jgi:hypothetical protein
LFPLFERPALTVSEAQVPAAIHRQRIPPGREILDFVPAVDVGAHIAIAAELRRTGGDARAA